MNHTLKKLTVLLTASVGTLLCAGNIQFNGGGADINFFYESAQDRWDVVLRNKGTTVATGLSPSNEYAGFTGIVGLGDDYTFSSLTTNIATSQTATVGSTTYLISSATGSPLNATGNSPDLGVRTRLREDFGSGVVQQFDDFNLTLNVGASTFNGNPLAGNAHVSLLHWDLAENPVAMIDTATSQLTGTFENYDHVHRNWGFSEEGVYDLHFDISGVGGAYGATAGTGSFNMEFNVIPEPSTVMLLLAGAAGLIGSRKLKKKHA